jgi:hypothetical protein
MHHKRFEFLMPAAAEVVFDAFHFHEWRAQWDTLVQGTHIVGGAPCPSVGAISENGGRGLLRGLSMRTQFISFDRPHVAAATLLGQSFPFVKWSASMRHKAISPQESLMVYTYNFTVGPSVLRWLLEPVVSWVFDRQTRKRFAQLQTFLALHRQAVQQWQSAQASLKPHTPTH